MKSAIIGAAIVLLSGAAAVAGPAGSGLSFTEDVARRTAAQRTITVAHSDEACAQRAAQTIKSSEGVAWAKARSEGVQVIFQSDDHASRHEARVRAIVTQTCTAA